MSIGSTPVLVDGLGLGFAAFFVGRWGVEPPIPFWPRKEEACQGNALQEDGDRKPLLASHATFLLAALPGNPWQKRGNPPSASLSARFAELSRLKASPARSPPARQTLGRRAERVEACCVYLLGGEEH